MSAANFSDSEQSCYRVRVDMRMTEGSGVFLLVLERLMLLILGFQLLITHYKESKKINK